MPLPNGSYGSVPFFVRVDGLSRSVEALLTIRPIPAADGNGSFTYLDQAGRQITHAKLPLFFDTLADYEALEGMVGQPAVLVSPIANGLATLQKCGVTKPFPGGQLEADAELVMG